jgi:hypothetical protein
LTIIATALITENNTEVQSLAIKYTPISTNTTNTNTTEANITTITITNYATTIVTSYIFQTYTSIQVVTLHWGIDPNITIASIITIGTIALIIGYIIGYRTKREEAPPKPERPISKPERRRK